MTVTASPMTLRPDDCGLRAALPHGVDGPRLVGRQEQRAALESLIDGVRAGRGGAIVVRGAPGSGKTHLLDAAVAGAADCLVIRSTGVEIESGLAFGAVQQLCGPLLDLVSDLPPPQAEALAVALGMSPGPAADPTLVGLALVSLFTAAGEDRPVVCVVDDVDRLDGCSAQAIGVAARRVAGLGVALLLASSGPDPIAAFAGVDETRIHPLSRPEAQLMLSLELPGRLDPAVRDRVLAEARGNPRTLRQLGRSTSVTALAGGFEIAIDAEVDSALDACVTNRLAGLPDDVSTALLLAAAEPLGHACSFEKALASAGLPAGVQRAAEATGLVEIGDQVLFAHPLVRHVICRRASGVRRREAHRVLAEAVDGTARPDHVVWHRSQASIDPSEDVANSLERCSVSALRSGGEAAAAAFLARAAVLSENPGAAARRSLDAARLHGRSGGLDDAFQLIAGLDDPCVADDTPAMAQLVAAEIAAVLGRPGAARGLVSAADRIAATHPGLSVSTCLSAFDAAASAGRFAADGGMHEIAARARPMTSRPGRTAAEQLLHAAVSRWSGDPRSHDVLAYAVRASRADGSTAHPTATRAAMELWDEDAAAILARRDVDRVRSSGASSALPRALDLQACLHVARGEMQAAVHAADEAATVARRTGAAEPALARILLTGWQATAEDRLEWIDAWSRRASSNGDGSALTLLDFGRALAHLASGRYEQALHDARRVFDRDESFISGWAAPDVVEAAVRSGRPDDAAPAFAWIRSVSDVTGSAWARGIEHRCRALLARDDSAEQHFVESVGHLTRSGMRLDLARTHLLHGEWLRRQARRVDARTSLRQALELFDAAGATAFAGRASIELRASGQQARPRTPDTLLALTDRESQVAELVIEGFSNPDIGRQLFISPRTVEYHLSKVFTKLGITSRAQLRAAWQR